MDFKTFEAEYLERLNPQQREAVCSVEGNILLLATPGSGKTTVLVTRLGYMVECKGISPKNILTMTYTKAATQDMKKRYADFFGEASAADLEFRTINGVSSKIISYAASLYGKLPFALLEDESAINAIIRDIYRHVNSDYAEDGEIKEIRTAITYFKNMMLTDDEIASYKTDIDRLPEIYSQYQATLRKQRKMDYDDQMAYALTLLQRNPDVLSYYQDQFPYVCVDEAQDTSKVQHEIIKLLAAKYGNLFMVGDEDQSIYGFRAAYPEALLKFESDHPGSRVLLMEENYRSTPEIIDAANRFIARNKYRHKKSIIATRTNGEQVHVIYCKNREMQFHVLTEIAKTCKRETAILFRNNDSALPLIDLFEAAGISYNCRNYDGLFFSQRIVTDIRDIIRFAYEPTNESLFMRIYYKFDAAISKEIAKEAVQKSNRSGKPIIEELIHCNNVRGRLQDAALELMDGFQQLKNDQAETAIHRIWEAMRYGRYVRSKNLDVGKYFILCMLAKGIDSPAAFLDKLDRISVTAASHQNSGKNKVILSTVHSSKGLEYQTVYLLDVLDGVFPSISLMDAQQNEDDMKLYEEERRLYYVGMTRAKDALYLFSFDESSGFTAETRGFLPVPDVDLNDVFASITYPVIDKIYEDSEWGKGVIIAQWDDHCMIQFADGAIKTLTMEKMLSRRAKRTRIASDRERANDTKSNPVQPPKPLFTDIGITSRLTRGTAVKHKSFGRGIVIDIQKDVVTIRFDKAGVKKLILSAVLQKGFLEIV